jgi:hypothetical protein
MYRQIFVSRFLPEATQEQWRSFDELQRRSTSPENAWRFVDAFANIDVTSLAPKLTVPTLIMCEDVPAFVELESGGPSPGACRVVGHG